MRAIVIGLGGIGSNVVDSLCRKLSFSKSIKKADRVILVDGDKYEEKNRERQRFTSCANKAEATKEWLLVNFPDLQIEAKPRYVDDKNIFLFVKEGDVVFCCVDNHATRKLVSDHMRTLENGLLISGGNELYDGEIQIYERRDGKDFTPPLTYHPEIEFPKDKNPAELSCGEIVASGGTQLLAVNLMVATLMLNAYALWLEMGELPYTECYFDFKSGNVRPVKRRCLTEG